MVEVWWKVLVLNKGFRFVGFMLRLRLFVLLCVMFIWFDDGEFFFYNFFYLKYENDS